ncbi:glutathione peroxidase [Aquimarina sp. M1]
MDSDIFKFEVKKLNGESISLKEFEGKTIVIVNTASKCGLTPQYKGLEYLYKKHKNKGLVILGFPCNQFGQQEKGTAEEISEFCEINYGVSFPMFDKVEVNGTNAHPLFKYLKSKLRGVFGSNIKWNFTKFIIDKNGNPVKRFAPTTKPEKMEGYLQKII